MLERNEHQEARNNALPLNHSSYVHTLLCSSPRHTDGHKEEEACYTWLVQLHIRYEVFVLVVLPPQENSSFWPKVFESSVLLTRSRHSSKLYGRPMRERTKTWLNIYKLCRRVMFKQFVSTVCRPHLVNCFDISYVLPVSRKADDRMGQSKK